VDRILLSTVAYRTPAEIFPTVRSFTDYPRYADHLESVRRHGDGGVGTCYDLTFSWWKLRYTARSRVTAIEEPTALSWQLTKDVDARGEWRIEAEPEAAPAGVETASRIYFEAVYDPYSANRGAISIPRFVSLEWVIERIKPRLLEEAERVVQRLVADIEGERRDVELVVHKSP